MRFRVHGSRFTVHDLDGLKLTQVPKLIGVLSLNPWIIGHVHQVQLQVLNQRNGKVMQRRLDERVAGLAYERHHLSEVFLDKGVGVAAPRVVLVVVNLQMWVWGLGFGVGVAATQRSPGGRKPAEVGLGFGITNLKVVEVWYSELGDKTIPRSVRAIRNGPGRQIYPHVPEKTGLSKSRLFKP